MAPLKSDNGALDRLEEAHHQGERDRQPEHHVHPRRRREGRFHGEHDRDQEVTGDENYNVGWEVVGPMVVKLLTASRAAVRDLKERAKQPAFAALRAPPEEAANYRIPK